MVTLLNPSPDPFNTPNPNSVQPGSTEPASNEVMPGWVNSFYRYHDGKKLGPYYVRRWKARGRLYKEYVAPEDVDRVRAACQAHRDRKRRQREASKAATLFLDNFNYLARMWKHLGVKGKRLRQEHIDHFERISREGCSALGRPKGLPPFMVPFFKKREIARLGALVKGLIRTKTVSDAPPTNTDVPSPKPKPVPANGWDAWKRTILA